MSITAIARQAQGIRAREVIAKLAEDAYFMRVDNRVNQPPPARNRDNEATSRSADCRCFRPANLPRGTRGSRLCGEDRDRETENSKVSARTRDTRFIQVRVAKVANPTSCLGNKYGALRLVLGCSDARLGTRPSFI
jgi:hypothetical protein